LAKKYFPNIAPAPSTRRNTGPLESQIQWGKKWTSEN
jgi:hypothetical protein